MFGHCHHEMLWHCERPATGCRLGFLGERLTAHREGSALFDLDCRVHEVNVSSS
jgi:hypothetical protein